MGLKEIYINCYIEDGKTVFVVGNVLFILINYILILMLKMSLPDWNICIWPPYEHYIYYFVYGFVIGVLEFLKQKIERNYIIPIITGEEVKKLYFWNMRKRMIKSEREKLNISREKLRLYNKKVKIHTTNNEHVEWQMRENINNRRNEIERLLLEQFKEL